MGSRPGAHICGKTSPIWKDLADAGLFSFSIDNCEDLAEAKKCGGGQDADRRECAAGRCDEGGDHR